MMAKTMQMMKIAFPKNRLITISFSYELYRPGAGETLELKTIANPQGVQALVRRGEIGIRDVIEHQGKAVVLSQRNADFKRDPEQEPRSELLSVFVR
jgi:hypothetical protein